MTSLRDTLDIPQKDRARIAKVRTVAAERNLNDAVMTRTELRNLCREVIGLRWAPSSILKNKAFQYRDRQPFLYVLSVLDVNGDGLGERASLNPGIIRIKNKAIAEYDAGKHGKGRVPALQSPENSDCFAPYVVEPPPQTEESLVNHQWIPKQQDWERLNEERVKCGMEGEAWILGLLKKQLIECGRSDLADKTEHVSHTQGDGAGYDILSFDSSGKRLFVEVKTTRSSAANAPFYLSPSELAFANCEASSYRLYRVFKWNGSSGKVWHVQGPLENSLKLTPASFAAKR